MEIRAILPRKKYLKLLRYFYFQRNLPAKIILPLCIACLVSFNMTFRFRQPVLPFILIFIILDALLFVFIFLTPYLAGKIKITRRSKNLDPEILKFSFGKEGFNVESGEQNKFIPWVQLHIADIFQKHIFFELYGRDFYILPATSFTSEGLKKDFLSYVYNQIQIHRPGNVHVMYRKGWLGLIPPVGAFVGIWLMVEGISRFKNRKLIFIGVGSFMFTAPIYGSLIYYGKYSKQYRVNSIPLTKDLLNKVLTTVEFYKTQKGNYPDSLEELRSIDPEIFIHDPIMQGTHNGTHGKFYYKKLGNKYTPFSCGVDRKPFTSDDIYPYYDSMSTGKIGLVRER